MPIPFIGAQINLTTKSGLRFEGTLQHINTQEQVVGLEYGKLRGHNIIRSHE